MSYKKRKDTSHCMRHTIIVQYPPKNMEVKTHLNTTKVELLITSRVNPPYHRKDLYVKNLHFTNIMLKVINEDLPTRPKIIIEGPTINVRLEVDSVTAFGGRCMPGGPGSAFRQFTEGTLFFS